jgi:biotin carboxyl carrier protein
MNVIEARKMKMPLHSLRDGRVEEILVRPADAINAKDLVLIFSK